MMGLLDVTAKFGPWVSNLVCGRKLFDTLKQTEWEIYIYITYLESQAVVSSFNLFLKLSREGETPLQELKHILSLEILLGEDSSAGVETWPLPEIFIGEEGLVIESEAWPSLQG